MCSLRESMIGTVTQQWDLDTLVQEWPKVIFQDIVM